MMFFNPSKIVIFGIPGSGKSTFARYLSKKLNMPVHHLDYHFYLPNWVERDYQDFLNIQQSIIETDQWIIDGNNTKSLEMRYKNADLILYFNYPKLICYWRVLKRFLIKNNNAKDRAPGCPETIRWDFLKYMWGFKKKAAPIITRLQNTYPNIQFLEINADNILKNLVFSK